MDFDVTTARITGVQGGAVGVRLHLSADGAPTTLDLTHGDAAELVTALMRALNNANRLIRLAVDADGLDIPLGAERPGSPQPLRVRTLQGPVMMLDLSWAAAEKLTALTEGLLRADCSNPPTS